MNQPPGYPQQPPPYPPFVVYVPPEKKSYTAWWIILGITIGILSCVACSLFLVLMNTNQRTNTTTTPLYSWDIDATSTAQAGSSTHTVFYHATSTDDAPSNPWGYNFNSDGGNYIYEAPANFCRYFKCLQPFGTTNDGFVVECQDGKFSHAGGTPDACMHDGGVNRALYWH